jgi:general secretion pathway protein K
MQMRDIDGRSKRSLVRVLGPRRRNGFALLAVIWGLGVISLLITSFMSNGRLRLQTAFNIAGATQAHLIAEGVINGTILSLLSERDAGPAQTDRPPHDGAPRFCSLAGAAVAIVIEDEGGKVDINSASPKLLQAMLMGFGLEMHRADALANAIIAFRSTPTNEIAPSNHDDDEPDKTVPSKRALFQTILELDQVDGIDAPLFRELRPFVTVHSRRQGLDARAAPPALFAALAGFSADDVQVSIATPFPNAFDRNDPRFPQTFKQSSDRGAFLLHAEVLLALGQTAVQEAVVDLRASSLGPYAIRELRRGATRYVDQLRSFLGNGAAALPDC